MTDSDPNQTFVIDGANVSYRIAKRPFNYLSLKSSPGSGQLVSNELGYKSRAGAIRNFQRCEYRSAKLGPPSQSPKYIQAEPLCRSG
jgi:hypothetical protein